MSKKERVVIDYSALFKVATEPTAEKTQKVVMVKANKRDSEEPYTLWIDKKLYKDLRILAAEEATNVKELIIEAVMMLRQNRNIPPFDL
jgi:hypothetical protein